MSFSSEDSEGNGESSHSKFMNDEGEFNTLVIFESDREEMSNLDGYCHDGDFENILHDATWHWPPLPVLQQNRTV